MSAYLLNPRDSHRQQLLNMVNHYNQASVGTVLTLADTSLTQLTEVNAETAETSTRLVNTAFPKDFTDVTYFRLQLAFVVDMVEAEDDFDWYTPDNWDVSTSPALAVAALKAAAVRNDVDLDVGADTVQVTRSFNEALNQYSLDFVLNSYVWAPATSYTMPRHFSQDITVTELNGFLFEAISAASVVV